MVAVPLESWFSGKSLRMKSPSMLGKVHGIAELSLEQIYLAPDRGHIQYVVKELSRSMSTPMSSDTRALKILGRYLVGRTWHVVKFERQMHRIVDAQVDTDHARCLKTKIYDRHQQPGRYPQEPSQRPGGGGLTGQACCM